MADRIFAPKSKNALIQEYPELSKYDEFKILKPGEMLFVWFYSCLASPIINIENDQERATKAYDLSHKGNVNQAERHKYVSGKFPEVINLAITKMRSFNLQARVRAKNMVDKIFSNYETMINIDPADDDHFKNAQGEVDWAKKKAFIDAQGSIVSKLEELVKLTEHSFSVGASGESHDDDDDESFIETYVTQIKGNTR